MASTQETNEWRYDPNRGNPYVNYQVYFFEGQMQSQQQLLTQMGESEASEEAAEASTNDIVDGNGDVASGDLTNGNIAGENAAEGGAPPFRLHRKKSNFSLFGKKNQDDEADARSVREEGAPDRPQRGLRRLKSAFSFRERSAGDVGGSQQQQSQQQAGAEDGDDQQQRNRRRGASFTKILRPVKSLTDLGKRVSDFFSNSRNDREDFDEEDGVSLDDARQDNDDVSDAESDRTVRAAAPSEQDEDGRSKSIYSRDVGDDISVGSSSTARGWDEDGQAYDDVVGQMEWAERQRSYTSSVTSPSPPPSFTRAPVRNGGRIIRHPRMVWRNTEEMRRALRAKDQDESSQRPGSISAGEVLDPRRSLVNLAAGDDWSMYSADVNGTSAEEWKDEESQARLAHLTTIRTPGGGEEDTLAALEGRPLPSQQQTVRKSKSVAFDNVVQKSAYDEEDYGSPVVYRSRAKSIATRLDLQTNKLTILPRGSDETQGTISPRTSAPPIQSSMRPVSMFEPNETVGMAMPHDTAYAGPSKTLQRRSTVRKAVSVNQLSEKAAGKRPARLDSTIETGVLADAAGSSDTNIAAASTPSRQAIECLQSELHFLETLRSDLRARRRRIESSSTGTPFVYNASREPRDTKTTHTLTEEAQKMLNAGKRESATGPIRWQPDDPSEYTRRKRISEKFEQEEREAYEALRASVDEVRREVEAERTSLDYTRRRVEDAERVEGN
ncbi:hypothetical protein LTR78_000771 [Recurvomyces mirabilis]|uniref:Uncharacterized protein n=1 Tax=Recurvomyces mirabilis TaxID=574656 RepID=A0AAE1C5Q2_9PEZI|nr:hypothetical protein LTR78_000771 [Recurvomyces mirabilis]KAK5158740.1 hypothetical protein LTS14_002848 [Recurvomyces mirabilis]